MGSQLSRLARPFALAAPLIVVTLVPATLYGLRSQSVADQADRFLVTALGLVDDGPAMALDPGALCDPASVSTMPIDFAAIDVDGDSHKASVTGIGFDAVRVDMVGRLPGPSAATQDDAAVPDGTATQGDIAVPDDIVFRLERSDGGWCVDEVSTLLAEDDS